MMVVKIKKRKKAKKMRGSGTHGRGARKKGRGKGHKGGKGMAGTGKRADQKKTLIIAKYGTKYFGKKGLTRWKAKKKKIKVLNLRDIDKNLHSLLEKYGEEGKLNLKDYKILGDGELTKKVSIIAKSFSKSAREKIEKIGGEVIELNKNLEKK